MAERHLVGSLLHLPADRVRVVLDRGGPEDLADPRHRAVLRLVARVAAEGVDPDPGAVHAEARRSGAVPMARWAELAALLVDLLTEVPHPAAADVYLQGVLDDALRRRLRAAAVRLGQAVGNADLASAVAAWRQADVEVAAAARGLMSA